MQFKGVEFITGKSKKFDRDLEKVVKILSKGTPSATDRMELIHIYQTAYHESGKIEGITSCDSSCNGCEFCQKMLAAAKEDRRIICGKCYDEAQERYKIHSRNRHGLNMVIMSSVEFTEEELGHIYLTEFSRINSSGDTPNKTYARNMLLLAKVNPKAKVGYWAKNTAPISAACDEVGKPSNVKLTQSSAFIGRPAKLAPHFDYTFTVYPDKKTCEAAIRNGASACNGKKCRACGFRCYTGEHEGTDIAEVLRGVSKEERQLIINMTI